MTEHHLVGIITMPQRLVGVITPPRVLHGTLRFGEFPVPGPTPPPEIRPVILGNGPPTPTDGREGDYYRDTKTGQMYGPKTEGEYGPRQNASKNRDLTASAGPASASLSIGNTVQFDTPGRIVAVAFGKPAANPVTTHRWRIWRGPTEQLRYQITEDEPVGVDGWVVTELDEPLGFLPGQQLMVSMDCTADNIYRRGGYAGSRNPHAIMTGTYVGPTHSNGTYPTAQSAGNNDYGIDVDWQEAIGFAWPVIIEIDEEG